MEKFNDLKTKLNDIMLTTPQFNRPIQFNSYAIEEVKKDNNIYENDFRAVVIGKTNFEALEEQFNAYIYSKIYNRGADFLTITSAICCHIPYGFMMINYHMLPTNMIEIKDYLSKLPSKQKQDLSNFFWIGKDFYKTVTINDIPYLVNYSYRSDIASEHSVYADLRDKPLSIKGLRMTKINEDVRSYNYNRGLGVLHYVWKERNAKWENLAVISCNDYINDSIFFAISEGQAINDCISEGFEYCLRNHKIND